MKIAVIGGGSTYSPELMFGLADRAETLSLETVHLMDQDAERLEVVSGFVRRMAEQLAPDLRIEAGTDPRAAVEGASFVITQIRVGGQAARLEDERLGKRHRIIGQETTGVGGLAKALRTIPVLLEYAATVERYAPDATLINFTNPVSVVTEAILTHGRKKTIGLCNIPISQRNEIAAQLGVSWRDVQIDSVGLNHLSFIRGVQVGGEEVLPRLIDDVAAVLASGHKPANIPDLDFPAALIQNLGMIPSDYLRYYFMASETVSEQQGKQRLRAEEVMGIERELLEHYDDPTQNERPAALLERGGAFYSHAALEIIEAVRGDTSARLIVDTENAGSIPELPFGACVEVPCRVDSAGAHPLPQQPLEPAIRGLIQHVKAYEELAIKAALSKSRRDLYLALLTHPLVSSASLAERIAETLAARLDWA